MEYQPIVASGNKRMARAEAAMAALQELAALPIDHPLVPQPQVIPPVMGPVGVPRLAPCPPPQPLPTPKPVRPLMSLQPRPQFSSLHLYQPPNSAASTEPPPPGVEVPVSVSDFTSDLFDDIRKFESTLVPTSADRPPENNETLQPEQEHELLGTDDEDDSPQFEEDSFPTSGIVGLLGDTPEDLEGDCDDFDEDVDYGGTSAEYDEFPHHFQPPFLGPPRTRDVPGIFGADPENIRPGFSGRPGAAFGRPRWLFYSPEFQDFTEDAFVGGGAGILGEYHPGDDEPCGDFFQPCEELEPFEAEFQSDIRFQNFVGFGQQGILRTPRVMQRPLLGQGPRTAQLTCPPRVHLQFPRGPPQQFPRPFDVCSTRSAGPLPQGLFRPHMRPSIRPFPRPY